MKISSRLTNYISIWWMLLSIYSWISKRKPLWKCRYNKFSQTIIITRYLLASACIDLTIGTWYRLTGYFYYKKDYIWAQQRSAKCSRNIHHPNGWYFSFHGLRLFAAIRRMWDVSIAKVDGCPFSFHGLDCLLLYALSEVFHSFTRLNIFICTV